MEPKIDDVKREIEESNFREKKEYTGMIMVHDDNIEEGCMIDFRKENAIAG